MINKRLQEGGGKHLHAPVHIEHVDLACHLTILYIRLIAGTLAPLTYKRPTEVGVKAYKANTGCYPDSEMLG